MAHIGNFQTKSQLKQAILQILKILPLCKTEQIAQLLVGHRMSPQKRASEILRELEKKDHLVESRERRAILGESKVYRLSQLGRKMMEITKPPIRLNTTNLNHYLAIGDFYLFLKQNGNLHTFETELRERFKVGTKEKLYCPDAFFIWNRKFYVLEVQITPTSKNRWEKKHEIRNLYFDPVKNYHHGASFQRFARNDIIIKPRMVIWSGSKESNVSFGSKEKLIIFKELADFPTTVAQFEKERSI